MSETARKPGPSPDSRAPDLLEILLKDVGPEAYAARDQETGRNDEAPARPPEIARRSGFGLWPLIVLGIAVMVLLRVLFEARATGNWAGLVAPLLAILFVAHGWWRLRQRRRDASGQPEGPVDTHRRD
jgi:hypothetical protein